MYLNESVQSARCFMVQIVHTFTLNTFEYQTLKLDTNSVIHTAPGPRLDVNVDHVLHEFRFTRSHGLPTPQPPRSTPQYHDLYTYN